MAFTRRHRDIRPSLPPPTITRVNYRNNEQVESGCISKQWRCCCARLSSKVYFDFTDEERVVEQSGTNKP